MTTLYYNVVDCEHEGDVNHAENELFERGAAHIIREDYEYEDDEDPERDHEICGCTIVFDAEDKNVEKLLQYGAYHY